MTHPATLGHMRFTQPNRIGVDFFSAPFDKAVTVGSRCEAGHSGLVLLRRRSGPERTLYLGETLRCISWRSIVHDLNASREQSGRHDNKM